MVILSICIPTFSRDETLKDTIKHLIKCPSSEIEIVISDNASPDNTREVAHSFDDTRIKYFRNKKNLGVDANIIKCVEHASGEFIFFLSDEDKVELNTIPWIIEKIKTNKDVTQIIGAIGDRRPGFKKIYYNPGNHIYTPGYESLIKIFFATSYISGIVIRRDLLDVQKAKRYIGIMYMHQVLLIQTLTKGYTICTSLIFCYISEKPEKSKVVMKDKKYGSIGLGYSHPLSRVSQVEYWMKLVVEQLSQFPKAQNILLKRMILFASKFLRDLFFFSKTDFFRVLYNFLKNNLIMKSPKNWILLWFYFFRELLKHQLR